MGTFDIDAGQLSFARKVDMLIEADPAAGIAHMEEEGGGDWFHDEWGTEGVQVPIYPGDRDRHHRPEVPDDTLADLDEWVREVYPNVPADALDFEEKTGLLADKAEEFYAGLNCTLVVGLDEKGRTAAAVEDALTSDFQVAGGTKSPHRER
jgi:hypothetical protein